MVFDDHEVANNWADETPEVPQQDFPRRRAAALQAYYENMPLRASARPTATGMQLYRWVPWGRLATFHLLDTRQYRTDQPCNDKLPSDCPARLDPSASLIGAEQERWLLDGFAHSSARWDLIAQQVLFSQLDLTRDLDAASIRMRGTATWPARPGGDGDRRIAGPCGVILSGDIHSHCAAEV